MLLTSLEMAALRPATSLVMALRLEQRPHWRWLIEDSKRALNRERVADTRGNIANGCGNIVRGCGDAAAAISVDCSCAVGDVADGCGSVGCACAMRSIQGSASEFT